MNDLCDRFYRSYRFLTFCAIILLLYETTDANLRRISSQGNSKRRAVTIDVHNFQFTAPEYNLSIEENSKGKDAYAIYEGVLRIGVPLPNEDAIVKYKIAEGDRHNFRTDTKVVGDFAFLRVRHLNGVNRELKDRYEFLIKAICRRKDLSNLETTARVNLYVIDRNDAQPIFEQTTYMVTLTDQVQLFSNVIQAMAFDADAGLNGEIYYSVINQSLEFTIDAVSGWIRTLKPLKAGVYELYLRAEDRESRLSNRKEDNEESEVYYGSSMNHHTAKAQITVIASVFKRPAFEVDKRTVYGNLIRSSQIVARIHANNTEEVKTFILIGEYSQGFHLVQDTVNTWNLVTVAGIPLNDQWSVRLFSTFLNAGDLGAEAITQISIDFKDKSRVELRTIMNSTVLSVNESSPLGFLIGKIDVFYVEGVEKSSSLRLRYSIIASDENDIPFSINKETAQIRMKSWLDYEQTKEYHFVVKAEMTEYDLESTVSVKVLVVDSNDHAPIFAARWTRGEYIAVPNAPEIGEIVAKVEAVDLDSGNNGHLEYMTVARNGTPFDINHVTGEVFLVRKIEDRTWWRLVVRSIDAGWPYPRSEDVILTLYLNGTEPPAKLWPVVFREQENQYPPDFVQMELSVTIDEDISMDETVLRLQADDKDDGYAGLMRYASKDEYFCADPHSGDVYIARNLHDLFLYGTNSIKNNSIERIVSVSACDTGVPVYCTNASITFIIRDGNNFAPRFERPFYFIHISEGLSDGDKILNVVAFDDDHGPNADVEYQLIGGDVDFSIESTTGAIRITKLLDRETQSHYQLTVMAYDKGNPPKYSFVNVSIEVDDVNDNVPKCAKRFQRLQIPEDFPNGALVTCIVASDADIGENGRITYSFDTAIDYTNLHIPFRIQSDIGCIFVDSLNPLHYEKQSIFNITVEVMDNGEPILSSTCGVLIELLNIVESVNPPHFTAIAYEASIYENKPVGTEVIAMKAEDSNHPNSPVRYSVIGGSGMGFFSIDQNGIIRTSLILDREITSQYWLSVQAETSANVPLKSVAHVFVRVLDVNDNSPLPYQPVYFANVLENSPEDTVVIEAEDKELLGSYNQNLLTFQIVNGDPQGFFAIDARTGYIITRGRRRLDRETQHEHEVNVEVCDQGTPNLCTIVPVIIRIDDVDDNPPKFKEALYNYDVPANSVGVLCRIFAYDLDGEINSKLRYNITADQEFLSVDDYGYISAKQPLQSAVSFVIIAVNGNESFSASAKVILTPVKMKSNTESNNRSPFFVNADTWSNLTVSESTLPGDVLCTVEAEDNDDDQMWWSILSQNTHNIVSIGIDNGQLTLTTRSSPMAMNESVLQLTVCVTDGIVNITTMITIEFTSLINQRPIFDATHYRTQLSRQTIVGTTIFKLKPNIFVANFTISKSSNLPIIFGIHSVENVFAVDKFKIDASTSEVILTQNLANEITTDYRMIVFARCGNLLNYATLHIAIISSNSTSPKFLQSEYFVLLNSMYESIASNSGVLKVKAYDPDTGSNGQLTYSIVSGNDHDFFILSETTGQLSISGAQNNATVSQWSLRIKVSDHGEPQQSDFCLVHVRNVLWSDQLPSFEKSVYTASVPKNTLPGALLTVASAYVSFDVRYHLLEPCPYMTVHPISGAIHLARDLQTADNGVSLRCTIRLRKNLIGHDDKATIVLNVIEVNENAPIFNQTVYYGYIQENMPAGTTVISVNGKPLQVFAHDTDLGLNGMVSYYIASSLERFFYVDFVSGVIRTKSEIDFEQVKQWSIHVHARDMGLRTRSSAVPALVVINVKDVNDEPPKFSRSLYHMELILPTVKGVHIDKVIATDCDTVGHLRFGIIDQELRNLFSIGENDGIVRASANNSSMYTEKQYKFALAVSDGLRSDKAAIIVIVKNSSSASHSDSTIRFANENYHVYIVENAERQDPQALIRVAVMSANTSSIVLYRLLNPIPEFVVGMSSGIVSWTGIPMDREAKSQIKLVVQARLVGKSEKAQCVVLVTVEDVNDCKPQFVNMPYMTVVSSASKIGEKVLSVKAYDADYGNNGSVRYFLWKNSPYFNINKYDGRISVARLLDKVKSRNVVLEVKAEDQGVQVQFSIAKVLVEIVDFNAPILTSRYYRSNVLENAAKGSSVVTVKAVGNSNGQIGYILKDGNTQKHFKVDFITGVVSVHRNLDREITPSYNLTVMAIDLSRVNISSECIVQIIVDDVNDSPPYFLKPFYKILVSEDTIVRSKLLEVTARDPDSTKSDLTFAITGANSSFLSIDPYSGHILLAKKLDYEKQRSYQFTLRVSDGNQFSSTSILILVVKDVNDAKPAFVAHTFHCAISSDAIFGQFITKLSVEDADSESNLPDGRRFLFSIIDGDVTLLQIEKYSGVVTLMRDIDDDDVLMGTKIFNVSVNDGIFTSFARLILNITASASKYAIPRFHRMNYMAILKENSPEIVMIARVQATNGIKPLKYSFGSRKKSESWPFDIDEMTGKIYAKAPVDYEKRSSYIIPVVVTDRAYRRAFTTLSLSIVDQNDNPPIFVSKNYEATINDNMEVGETIVMVLAVDRDVGDTLEYSIVPDDANRSFHFSVHIKQGVISLNRSVRSLAGERISFLVRASDLANPPHQNEAVVMISIVSSNVVLSHLITHHFLFDINENVEVGTVIGSIRTDSAPSDVVFSIDNGSETFNLPFAINRTTGAVFVISSIDRELVDEIRFIARIYEKLNPEFSTFTTVTVKIRDVNDNAPKFDGGDEQISLFEDSPIGTMITVISAHDEDLGSNSRIYFELDQSLFDWEIKNSKFKIDRNSGWLTIAERLDREEASVHNLTVVVSDEGNLKSLKRITITVLDINDCTPVFDKDDYFAEFSIHSTSVGQKLVSMHVKDEDITGVQELYIVDGNERNLFSINSENEIILHDIPLQSNDYEYRLSVVAFDGKHTAKAVVNIKFLSLHTINKCPESTQQFRVSEDAVIGTVLLAGNEALVKNMRHSLTTANHNLEFFNVTDSGSIILSKPLDRETLDRVEMTLKSEAENFLCVAKLVVIVTDVNDEPPVFHQSIVSVSVKENLNALAENRIFLARLEAEDRDYGANGDLRYRFATQLNDSLQSVFHLDHVTGVLTLLSPLDREISDRYQFTVQAFDIGNNTADVEVVIQVADENDNEPQFESNVYHVKVVENETIGAELVRIHAVDADGDENVRYHLDQSDYFEKFITLDEEKGLLKLAAALDYELLRHFTLKIIATDSGSPPLSSRCLVDIEVLDINDNAPHFRIVNYKTKVLENSDIGTKIAQIIATDLDSEHFGRIKYGIIGGSNNFVIDDEGWLKVNAHLNREMVPFYQLEVIAEDGGSPPLTNTTSVFIDIEDENDNPPTFLQCNMTAVVQEGTEAGYSLLTVALIDKDIGPNAEPFRLEIIGQDAESFAFDFSMNLITTTRLSHSKKDVYLLSVRAYDNGGLWSECPLTIYVREESRHPPIVEPLEIALNVLFGEFLGGTIGAITASDIDEGDMLRYSIVNTYGLTMPNEEVAAFDVHDKLSKFSIDGESGEIYVKADLLAGVHRFNVSVTDGRFTSLALVTVAVNPIDQDSIDHSIGIRLRDVTGLQFLKDHSSKFHQSLAHYLNIKPSNIRILAMQPVNHSSREAIHRGSQHRHHYHQRHRKRYINSKSNANLDILLVISRGDSLGFHRPTFIRSMLEKVIAEFAYDVGLEVVSLITELCSRSACLKGDCRDRLYFDDITYVRYTIDRESFNAPEYMRTFECLCQSGFAGRRCDIPIDKCSQEQCAREEICVPTDTDVGFECVCPPGLMGDRCAISSCGDEKQECSKSAHISVNGTGFLEINIANSLERRLELSIVFRTVSSHGILMYSSGSRDFHAIEIADGFVQYQWDSGTGLGLVKVERKKISDGKWHTLKVSRRSRHVKLLLDDEHMIEGDSPPGSSVVNLHWNSMKLIFGARVRYPRSDAIGIAAHELIPIVQSGIVGCFERISIDGFDLPKSKQGLRLYKTRMSCDAIGNALCLANPCGAEGKCIPTVPNSFSCVCPPRYKGIHCEIDLAACLSRPCPPGIPCINLHNDFYCSCSPGFTGKTCQLRGEANVCLHNPCGEHGICIQLANSQNYICNCSHGYYGTTCNDRTFPFLPENWTIGLIELIAAMVVLIVLLIVTISLVICFCMKCRDYKTQRVNNDPEYETGNCNPRVSQSLNSSLCISSPPPPLPPRGLRPHRNHLSNFEQAQRTGLPTVQVAPFPAPKRAETHEADSNSPHSPSCKDKINSRKFHRSSASMMNSQSALDSSPLNNFEALRKFGRKLSDKDSASNASSQGLLYRSRSKRKLSEEEQYLSGTNASRHSSSGNNWRIECDSRIKGACGVAANKKSEKLKQNPTERKRTTVKISASNSDDDDYMTMRPLYRNSRVQDTNDNRSGSLNISSTSDENSDKNFTYPDGRSELDEAKPLPPAHRPKRSETFYRVYDEPTEENKSSHSLDTIFSSADPGRMSNIDDSYIDDGAETRLLRIQKTMAVL